MGRKIKIGLLIFLSVVVIGYGQFWLRYYWAMEKSNKETAREKCNDHINEQFTGTIKKIERYEYSEFMNANFFGLDIVTEDSANKHVTYQFNLEPYRDVLDFVALGQIIEKRRGMNNFTLRTELGQERTFTVPDCRLTDD